MTGTSGVPGETNCGQLPYALLSMGAMNTVLKQQLLADSARLRARLQSQAQIQPIKPGSEPDCTATLRARLHSQTKSHATAKQTQMHTPGLCI